MKANANKWPKEIPTESLGILKREEVEASGTVLQRHYTAVLVVPGCGPVQVVVIPNQDHPVESHKFAEWAERKVRSVISALPNLASSGCMKINTLCQSYVRGAYVPLSEVDIREGFRLTAIKVSAEEVELIYRPPTLYSSWDLNVRLTTQLQIDEVWFDG